MTWRTLPLIVALGMSLTALQAPHEPYPGQGSHAEPPPDWFCTPTAADPDHVCHCKRMDYTEPVCDSPPKEDAVCTVYCHADHCRYPIACATPPQED